MTKKQHPYLTTVHDVVQDILKTLSDKGKATIKNTPKRELSNFHHGWGTGIRNQYGLWRGNEALLKDTGRWHPDNASMVIMEAVWDALQKT